MSENSEKNKKEVEIILSNRLVVYTQLSEDSIVDLIAILQSGKEGIVSVMEGSYTTLLKARCIVGVRVQSEEYNLSENNFTAANSGFDGVSSTSNRQDR